MRLMMAALAVFALVLGACETDDAGASPVESPLGTVDLLPSPDETAATDASPAESPEEEATESPDETAEAEATEEESPEATEDDDEVGATGSPGATDDGAVAAGTCEEAFGEVPDLTRMDSLSDLRQAFEALDATIQSCESIDEWTEQAEEQLDFANLDLDAEEFLQSRCESSEDLAETELCEEVG